ncbi:MAG: hypothetical protein ACLFVU_10140, partial [Phycisphaerae bacterium]
MGRLGRRKILAKLARSQKSVDFWYGVEPDSAQVAVSLAEQFGGRAIFSIHEVYHDEMAYKWAPSWLIPIVRPLLRRHLERLCDRCDLLEAAGLTRLGPYKTGRTESVVVRNCASLHVAENQASQPFPPNRDEIVLMHGRGWLSCGSATVIEAARIVADRTGRRPRVIFLGT